MNGRRIAGQVLLWAGFISAALAASSKREFDLLPDSEKAVLAKLPEEFEVTSEQFAKVTSKGLDELSLDELANVVDEVIPIFSQSVSDKEDSDSVPIEKEEEKKAKPITAADFADSRVTRIDDKWPAVPWLWYGLSMAVGLVGVVLLRATAKHADQEHGRVAEQFSSVNSNLANLNSRVTSLCKNFEKMSPAEIVYYIDEECAGSFAGFADSRNALIQRFGLQAYAEIMTQFASAERFVNRAWSASADGYMQEAKNSILRASAHLDETANLIGKYDLQSSTPQDS